MKRVEVDIDKIHDLIFAFANGDFSKRMAVSKEGDHTDTIVAGVNMLGEELEHSTVSKDYFRSIYNAISDIVIVVDLHGKVSNVNKASIAGLGSKKERLIGMSIFDLFPLESSRKALESVILNGSSSGAFETIQIVDDRQRYLSCMITKIQSKFKSHEGYLITARDVTAERNMEGEVLNAVIETEERERNRLAYDLHDALGQELNSVKMMFDVLIHMDTKEERYQEVLELCRNTINDCIDSTRMLSHDLMPKTLDDEKLFSAFEELERKNKEIIQIQLYLPENEYAISKRHKINIYRVVQEFVTNSLKHANATEIVIKSYIRNNTYVFHLSDNGDGFVYGDDSKGSGLKNMQSRLKTIDAEYDFESEINYGTTLKFSFK